MDISLSVLADEISQEFPQVQLHGDFGTNITYVRQWQGESVTWETNCLYCTNLHQLPCGIPPETSFLYCMEEAPKTAGEHFILLGRACSPETVVLHVQEVLLRLFRWQTALLHLSMDSEDIQKFITISTPIFQNLITIHSLVQNVFFADSPVPLKHWNHIQEGYLGNATPPEWLSPKKLNILNGIEGPGYYQCDSQMGRLLIDNVVCDGIRVATIIIIEGERKLSGCHEQYLQLLRRCLKRVFQRILQKPKEDLSGALTRLLCHQPVSEDILLPLCKEHGWRLLEGSYRICVIVPRNNNTHMFVRNQLFFRDLIAGIYSKSVVFHLEDTIVLVRDFSVNHYSEEGPNSLESLQRLLDNIDACMGSSAPFTDLRNVAIFYEQAKCVAFNSKSKGHTLNSHEYPNYLVYDIISSFTKNREIEFYLHPSVSAIATYDAQHGTKLMSALYYYLLNDRSYKICADKLHLHRNTFAYRVEKALSFLDCDLSSEHVRLSIILSICMYWCLYPEQDAIGLSSWRAQLYRPSKTEYL